MSVYRRRSNVGDSDSDVEDDLSSTPDLSMSSCSTVVWYNKYTKSSTDDLSLTTAIATCDKMNTSLHTALILHDSPRKILQLIRDHPEYCFIRNKSGDLPLHYAAMDKLGVDESVLDALLKTYPRACTTYNSDRSLPLHLHCMIGAPSFRFIRKCLKIFPGSVFVQSELVVKYQADYGNNISQTLADGENFCLGGNELSEIIRDTLSRVYKYVEKKANSKHSGKSSSIEVGWSPLHLAVYNGAPIEVIKEFVNRAPRCVFLKTSQNRTALECARTILSIIDANDGVEPSSKFERQMFSLMKKNERNTLNATKLLEHVMRQEKDT